jgi:hypothetical protein
MSPYMLILALINVANRFHLANLNQGFQVLQKPKKPIVPKLQLSSPESTDSNIRLPFPDTIHDYLDDVTIVSKEPVSARARYDKSTPRSRGS